eukprot:SAG31_NODE_2865_length_4981_cov_4.988529_6_plen_121_part_00
MNSNAPTPNATTVPAIAYAEQLRAAMRAGSANGGQPIEPLAEMPAIAVISDVLEQLNRQGVQKDQLPEPDGVGVPITFNDFCVALSQSQPVKISASAWSYWYCVCSVHPKAVIVMAHVAE